MHLPEEASQIRQVLSNEPVTSLSLINNLKSTMLFFGIFEESRHINIPFRVEVKRNNFRVMFRQGAELHTL